MSASVSTRFCAVLVAHTVGRVAVPQHLPVIRRNWRRRASVNSASTECGCDVAKASAVVTPLRSSSSRKNSATCSAQPWAKALLVRKGVVFQGSRPSAGEPITSVWGSGHACPQNPAQSMRPGQCVTGCPANCGDSCCQAPAALHAAGGQRHRGQWRKQAILVIQAWPSSEKPQQTER